MSQKIIDFIKACQDKENLLDTVTAGNREEIAKIASNLGFSIDVSELLEFVRGARPADEMSPEELAAVTGGKQSVGPVTTQANNAGVSGGYVCAGLSKGLSCWGC